MASLAARGFSANGSICNGMGGEVYPRGLYELLRIKDGDGKVPVYMIENGAACGDEVANGRAHDEERRHYLEHPLSSVAVTL